MEPAPSLIRVFERDPDLLEGLDDAVAEHLRRRMAAPCAFVEPGPWSFALDPAEVAGHFGLLVVDGLLVRTVALGGRESSEVVGPGDLIRPWEGDELTSSVEAESQWRVLVPTTFAVLDARFAQQVGRFPVIPARLLSRGTRRSQALVHQATIAHVRHARTRVLLALWHLADRWGKVTVEGVRVPVPLTHQLLAQITCLQRPTVSSAVSRLTQDGAVSRSKGGGWVLHGQPPRPVDDRGGHLEAA